MLTLKRILFVRTDRFGETLLNLPAIEALRTAYPTAHLAMMVRPEVGSLLEGLRGIDQLIEYQDLDAHPWWQRALRLAWILRREHLDVAIISNPKKEFHVAAFLAGIPLRVGYNRKWGWTLTHRLTDDKALGERHEVEYNLELLNVLGIPSPSAPVLQLSVSPEDERSVLRLLEALKVPSHDRLVAVHPWTSNPRKQWPLERFQALIHRLRQRSDITVAIVGGQEMCEQASTMAGDKQDTVLNLTGRLSLKELAAFLYRSHLLVTNDSGPMHLAAAVGTPVVALFGTEDAGSHPRRWGPWGNGHTVIHKPLSDISVDQVFEAVQRYLT